MSLFLEPTEMLIKTKLINIPIYKIPLELWAFTLFFYLVWATAPTMLHYSGFPIVMYGKTKSAITLN